MTHCEYIGSKLHSLYINIYKFNTCMSKRKQTPHSYLVTREKSTHKLLSLIIK